MNAPRMTRQALPGGHDVEPRADGLGAKLVTTGMAWLVVYLLLLTLFSILEDQLATLTLPVRLLVVSGVLVTFMANLVMPMVIRIVGAWIGRKVNHEASPRFIMHRRTS
jgi:antibiotic biosynthesis monooxygenase (ABM) superfamily enzyme